MLPATRTTNRWPSYSIEDQFHRHAGIGAGQHRGKRLLLLHGILFEDGQILVE